jgi:hypothetical protein
MSFLDSQSQAWDSAFWEFSLVFEDLNDADLWVRPHANLLSVGEITCHIVYYLTMYANKLAADPLLTSPLAIQDASYYLKNVGATIQLSLDVADVAAEVDRIQKAAKSVFLAASSERDEPLAFDGPGRTFGEFADYMVFHIAYHTGQAFSVRHLMGHKTNDN